MKYLESIRDKYKKMGVEDYYRYNKDLYKNPHGDRVNKTLDWVLDNIQIGKYLDLSCGDGQVTEYLISKGFTDFKASDPYLWDVYTKKFGIECYPYSFQDIAKNGINENFDTIICSYALHLCPKSYMNNLLYNISISCEWFVVISPSKYPIISDYFELYSSSIINRTHVRIYKSL